MENIFDVSVILPIKTATAHDFEDFFSKCIDSLKNQKTQIKELLIIHTDEELLTKIINEFDFGNLNVKKYSWTEDANYMKQINFGIDKATSTWISFFEFDDEFSSIWFNNVKKYSEIYTDISAFLPIVIDVDNKGYFAGFTNEATFASSFAQEMGFLTNDMLHTYQNFQTSGMVIKKESLEEFGKFKTNFKLTFSYEFFLRLTFNSLRIMTIPKIGYKHMNLRDGSIFWDYKNGNQRLSEDEVKFWIDSAKKEYFFKEQRILNYEPKL